MIPNSYIDFYGDQTRWFIGVVVNVKDDPEKLGRVKVRVFGVYDDIDEADLPWAQIVVPVTTGIHKGQGQNLGILKGTQVFGMFLDGKNSQLPMVIGTVPKTGDTNEKAKENYPLNKVYETETGHYKEYDDTPGAERIKEKHKGGAYYEMDKDGNISIYVPANGDKPVSINLTVGGSHGKVSVSANTVNINGSEFITLNSGG